MKTLITGGAGFIGSHLAEALLARGEEVVVLDDLSTGSLQNILPLMRGPRFEFVLDSIMNEAVVGRTVEACDAVYHLAAAVGVRLVFEQPVRTIETNVKGTQHVLDACLRHGRKEIGRASCRERVEISVVAVALQKKKVIIGKRRD